MAKERRDALLRNKRLRREPLAANGSANIAELSEAPSEAAVQQVVEQLQQERSIGSVTHLQTLQQLRQVLSTGQAQQLWCSARRGCMFLQKADTVAAMKLAACCTSKGQRPQPLWNSGFARLVVELLTTTGSKEC